MHGFSARGWAFGQLLNSGTRFCSQRQKPEGQGLVLGLLCWVRACGLQEQARARVSSKSNLPFWSSNTLAFGLGLSLHPAPLQQRGLSKCPNLCALAAPGAPAQSFTLHSHWRVILWVLRQYYTCRWGRLLCIVMGSAQNLCTACYRILMKRERTD